MIFVMPRLYDLLLYPFRWVANLPRAFVGLSLAARIAWLVAVFLVICVICSYAAFYVSPDRSPWEIWWRPGRIAMIAGLLVAIPFIVYAALNLWLQGDASRFPDIDFAWKAGVQELERHGIKLTDAPIFLMLGASDEARERQLFEASGYSFTVTQFPAGPAALHWYANRKVIFLSCTATGQLSRLAALADSPEGVAPLAGWNSAAAAAQGMTMVPGGGGFAAGSFHPGSAAAPQYEATLAPPQIMGTLVPNRGAFAGDAPAPAKAGLLLNPGDAAEEQRRLAYVCELINGVRQPYCPVNGVLTVLEFGNIERGAREAIALQQAIKSDTNTLRTVLKLRCPVVAMITGLETEPGFRELVRRVGNDQARSQRFGKGFGVWNPPLAEQVEAVSRNACGAFEDWVYALFRNPNALQESGNRQLYALLSKIRNTVQDRLTDILVAGFSDGDAPAGAEPLLFGGCYFAAAGSKPEQRAFVRAVFDRLIEQQEELEWTTDALRDDGRMRQLAVWSLALDVLLVGALGAMAYSKFR